jgi:hypothetical protein
MIKKILILSLVSSCAFMDKENFIVLKDTITGYPQNIVTESLFAEKRFSFAEVSLGRGPSAILSLTEIKDDIYRWKSIDNVSIYTYKGFIIKTEGLEHDISTNSKSLSLEEPLKLNINFLEPELYGIEVQLMKLKSEANILEKGWLKTNTTLHHIARGISFLKWRKVDRFWVNTTTRMVDKSVQHIHPDLPPINMIFYYKYK